MVTGNALRNWKDLKSNRIELITSNTINLEIIYRNITGKSSNIWKTNNTLWIVMVQRESLKGNITLSNWVKMEYNKSIFMGYSQNIAVGKFYCSKYMQTKDEV